tara:strand:+ start:5616 stop:5744 length:129 start_codon:yes stop_codon:yes gene_type:complete
MIETLKHLTGVCGEPHINLTTFTILVIGIFVGYKLYKQQAAK